MVIKNKEELSGSVTSVTLPLISLACVTKDMCYRLVQRSLVGMPRRRPRAFLVMMTAVAMSVAVCNLALSGIANFHDFYFEN